MKKNWKRQETMKWYFSLCTQHDTSPVSNISNHNHLVFCQKMKLDDDKWISLGLSLRSCVFVYFRLSSYFSAQRQHNHHFGIALLHSFETDMKFSCALVRAPVRMMTANTSFAFTTKNQKEKTIFDFKFHFVYRLIILLIIRSTDMMDR